MSENVTKAEFARSIGKNRAYIPLLIKRGLPVNTDGTIPKTAATRWYKANVVTRAKPTKEKPTRKPKKQPEEIHKEAPEGTEDETQDPPEYEEEKIDRAEADRRLTVAKAELAELELLKARGVLIEADSAVEVWGAMISAAKARALVIPTSLATKLARESDPVACETLLRQEIDQMLFELSDYRPSDA